MACNAHLGLEKGPDPHTPRALSSSLCLCYSWLIFTFTYLFEKWRDTEKRERQNHPLVHSPNAHDSLRWVRLKPGARIHCKSPTWLAGTLLFLSHYGLPPSLCIRKKLESEQSQDLDPGSLCIDSGITSRISSTTPNSCLKTRLSLGCLPLKLERTCGPRPLAPAIGDAVQDTDPVHWGSGLHFGTGLRSGPLVPNQ